MKKERKSFILFTDFADKFELLCLEDRGTLITAVFDYVMKGEEYTGENMLVRLAFSFIRSALDRGIEAYDERCERNAKNGKKGGRPRQDEDIQIQDNPEDPGETQKNPEKPRETQNNPEEPRETLSKSKSDSNNKSNNKSDSDSKSRSESESRSESKSDSSNDPPPTPCDAPLTPCDTPYDSPSVLTQKQRENLIFKGVSEEYINERLPRAQEYAEKNDRSAFGVLMSWWEEDKRQRSFVSSSPPYAAYRSQMREESEIERRGREAQEWFDRRIKQTFGE